jgi:hypothetical protein
MHFFAEDSAPVFTLTSFRPSFLPSFLSAPAPDTSGRRTTRHPFIEFQKTSAPANLPDWLAGKEVA